jgi:hypothetical protein
MADDEAEEIAYVRSRSGRMSHFKNILSRLRTIPPQNADAKERIVKPGTNEDASSIIAALTTNQKIPSVRIVSGKVMIFRKNPSVALINPIKTAAISAAAGPFTTNPGTNLETIQIASALRTQCRSNLIIFGVPLKTY